MYKLLLIWEHLGETLSNQNNRFVCFSIFTRKISINFPKCTAIRSKLGKIMQKTIIFLVLNRIWRKIHQIFFKYLPFLFIFDGDSAFSTGLNSKIKNYYLLKKSSLIGDLWLKLLCLVWDFHHYYLTYRVSSQRW